MRIVAKLSSIFVITILLASCFCEPCPQRPIHFENPCDYLILSLHQQAIPVIKRGDTLRIILPVDMFFEPASTKVKPNVDFLLYQVAQLTVCRCYNYMPIRVNGYTDNIGTIRQQKQRSLIQARNVAAFLWFAGIPLDRITVRGFGARGSIASNVTPRGEAYNRRVEILIP